MLSNLISEENTSIIECERIYQRFGFSYKPIIVNEGQQFVKKVFDSVRFRSSDEYLDMVAKPKRQEEVPKRYCKTELIALNYDFYSKSSKRYSVLELPDSQSKLEIAQKIREMTSLKTRKEQKLDNISYDSDMMFDIMFLERRDKGNRKKDRYIKRSI